MSQMVAEALPQASIAQARRDMQSTVSGTGSGSTPNADAYPDLDDPRFNQTFTLAPGPGRPEPFHVTYSDYGYHNPDEPERENVLLFCGPLLSSRFLHVAKDKLAKKYHVRIINPDRPGVGGTTEVDAHLRLKVWLEIVPALLQHLNVSHVTLACQSAGTIYVLHTLLHLRHLLRPDRPYVAFCGPWVHPTHSGVSLMALSSMLPSNVLRHFDSVAGFVQSTVGPAVGFSSGLLSSLTPSYWGQGKPPPPMAEGADAEMVEWEEKTLPRFVSRTYAENVSGMGQEVLLLLKKREAAGPSGGGDLVWGTWGDVDKFVPMLATLEEERAAAAAGAGSTVADSSAQLQVEIYFAESDNMIGAAAGPQWLVDCWKPEHRGRSIRFQSHVVEGTEHDTILNLRFGVAEKIFRKIAGISEETS